MRCVWAVKCPPTFFRPQCFNTLRSRQNGRHFADDIFKYIFLNQNVWIPNKISLKFVPKGQINNIPALVQIIPWCRPGDKPLSEPMMVRLKTHICVTRPQWVNDSAWYIHLSKYTYLLKTTHRRIAWCLLSWLAFYICYLLIHLVVWELNQF